MIDTLRLQKVLLLMLFTTFFLWFDFWLRSWIAFSSYGKAVCNSGGPFGVILPEWLLGIIVLIAIGALVWFFLTDKASIFGWPVLLLLAGGLGNFLERFLFGCIMDYIDIPFFPVFNIADVLLTLGAIAMLWKFLLLEKNTKFW